MDLEKFCDVYIASTNKCDVTGQNQGHLPHIKCFLMQFDNLVPNYSKRGYFFKTKQI